uniref:Uncharacterized protein n=1 Tax=Leersia perrieri TaxID=77586 RepID=A0A0D9VBT9_9ORYZ
MATEEEAREATDGQEVQVEDANDTQTQLDSKLSSIKEIKGEAHTTDSTEGILKIPEDQVLVEAPSETKIPPEHNLNGVSSSLNGHVDKEENISNEQPHEINQESPEQVETSPDGTSTHPTNRSREEDITESLSQGESASEDTTLLNCENVEAKDHDQQDFEGGNMMQEENSTIDNAVEQTVDAQDVDSSKETKDTQPAITANIPDDKVLVEAPSGIQSPLETNVDDSDAIPDTIDGNKETDELAKEDDISYIDHKESFPKDEVIAEHENEEVKVEDQQSKKADDIDAEVSQEEIPESKESDLPKTEQANEAPIDYQEALNQEPALENNDTLSVKAEETCDQSNVATCGERTPEDDVTTRVPTVSFDEAIQDHAATTDPSSDVPHIQNIEPAETKAPNAVEAEELSSQSNVAFAEDAVQDKVIPSEPSEDIQPEQELEQEETKKADEASNQMNPATFSNLNQEDVIVASETHATELAEEAAAFSNLDQEGGVADIEPHVTELEEAKETEVTETEEATYQSPAAISTEVPIEDNSTASEPHNDDIQHSLEHDSIGVEDTEAADIQGTFHERTIATSKEDIVEDNGTAEGPTSVSPEAQDVESAEETKDSKADDLVEASNVTTVDVADQENNVLMSENIAEQKLQVLESEEINSPEPVETEEDLSKSHAAPFNDPAEEASTANVESAEEIKDNKADNVVEEASDLTTVDDADQENNVLTSENIAEQQLQGLESEEISRLKPVETETDLDKRHAAPLNDPSEEVNTTDTESAEEIKDNKAGNVVEEASDVTPANDADQENNVLTSENISEQQLQGLETEVDFGKSHTAPSNDPAEEVNTTACETENMESAVELKETEDTKTESIPQESNAELESIQDMKDTEATEPELISQEDIVYSSEVSVPVPAFDDREIQNDEPELTKEHDGVKAEEIPNQSYNWTRSEVEMSESSEQMGDTEPTVAEPTIHDSNVANIEEIETHGNEAIEQNVGYQQLQEQESVEFKETEVLEPQGVVPSHNTSSSEESNQQETVTKEEPSSDTQIEESSVVIKDTEDVNNSAALSEEAAPKEHILATVDTAPVQEPELEEIKNIESIEAEDSIEASDLPGEEMATEAIETELIPHENTTPGVKELNGDLKSNDALADEAASEEHILETEVTIDKSSAQEPELEEIKNIEPAEQEHNVTETALPEEKDSEAMETEAVPHDSNIESIKELSEEDIITASAQDVDSQQVPGQESVEDMKCTDTTEHPGETPEIILSTSDELNKKGEIAAVTERTFDTQQVQSFTDQETELSYFPIPEEVVQESDLPKSEPETDVQEKQELDSAEETNGTENYQQNVVSTFEESVTEVEPNVDDQHVQEDKSAVEVKENEDTETEEIPEQINLTTSDNAAQESSESVTDQTFCVQPVEQIELTKDSKDNQLVEEEETSRQSSIVTPEVPTAEDTVENESLQDYPVEPNEENLGNGIDNVISAHEKIEDNIHESAELKDNSLVYFIQETSELGEKTQISVNRTEEDDKISTEDTEETSDNINLVKERPNEHGSSQISNVQDNEQLHDVALQTQVRERSVDTIVIGQQDEAVKNVNLDQQQKEDEEIEKQKETLQIDEQKHDDNRADPIIDTQVESIDAFEAEQTEPVITEMLNDEVTQSKDSIPRTQDTMVENIAEIKEETEEENGPNNVGALEVPAKNYSEDVEENTDKDATVAKTSSIEQNETTGEVRNEEVKPCLASSLERDLEADSDLSNDQMLENNDEYRLHGVEEEYSNKVNIDMHAIQESDKVIEDEEKQGMQTEDNVVCHDESLITTQKEETAQLHTDEQDNVDTKMDDATISYAEMTHGNTGRQPKEVEDVEEKKGLDAFPEFAVETSNQNDVDQDFSIHQQVEDEKSAATENNDAVGETVESNLDMSIPEINNDSHINENRQYQEATIEDASDNIETGQIEKTETSYTATTEVDTLNEDICDKASGTDAAPSEESLKTSEDTRRDLDVSSVVTESKGENMNKEMEDHKLAPPVHPTQDENTIKQGFGLDDTEEESMSPEKALPAEPEQEENQINKKQNEEDRHDPELGDAQKEVEQDYLPVSSFLMNLILGKESDDPKRDSETEVEKKQEETMQDDSSLITSQQEESLMPLPTEDKVDENPTFDQEEKKLEESEETKETVQEQRHDVELDVQKSLEADEELKRNNPDLEEPLYQDNGQDEISSRLISTKAADLIEKMEARHFELDEKSHTVCQENVEVATETEEGSLNKNQDDKTSTKASHEDASEEVGTELPHESLHESTQDAKAEEALSLIEPDVGNTAKFPNDADRVQSPPCTEQEESIESSYVEVRSTDAQEESEVVEMKEENQHTIGGGYTEEQIGNLHDDKLKGTCSEATTDVQTPEITGPVSHTDRSFAYEKEIPACSACMDKKENTISNNKVLNSEKALDIHSDSPNLHDNQDKSVDNPIVMEHNTVLDKLEDSNLHEEQEIVAQKLPKETEENREFMAITEPVIKEENAHETVESNMQTMKTKSNEEQELFDSHVQERGLDAISPKATSEAEENFVEITKPEFSTDEEHSPKTNESNMPEKNTHDEKTKVEEETNNITDDATVKVEERGAEQKVSHKKHNILSGVGSKVKHQLAKVKKAIIGKPGHTKSESPKS